MGYVWAYLSVVELFIQISLLPQCSDSFPSIFTTKMLPLITIFILGVNKVTKKILHRMQPQAGLLLLTQQKTLHEYWHIACTVKDIKQTNRLPCVACLIKEFDNFFHRDLHCHPYKIQVIKLMTNHNKQCVLCCTIVLEDNLHLVSDEVHRKLLQTMSMTCAYWKSYCGVLVFWVNWAIHLLKWQWASYHSQRRALLKYVSYFWCLE